LRKLLPDVAWAEWMELRRAPRSMREPGTDRRATSAATGAESLDAQQPDCVGAGERCYALSTGRAGDPPIHACTRTCTMDAECAARAGHPGMCMRFGGPTEMFACYQSCTSDLDCPLDTRCDTGFGVCQPTR
jgi:hypothetical protein